MRRSSTYGLDEEVIFEAENRTYLLAELSIPSHVAEVVMMVQTPNVVQEEPSADSSMVIKAPPPEFVL
jgi:hypothetical protein